MNFKIQYTLHTSLKDIDVGAIHSGHEGIVKFGLAL